MQSPRETLLCHYRYDALDRLIANELASTPKRQRFYCKSRLATEIQGANQYSMFQHGDQLLAQQQSEGDVLDATLLATDQQRSVLHTVTAHQKYPIAYCPYGHRSAENGLLSLMGFTGERQDPVTGHYLLGNGYRAVNPVLMRFNSPDSLSPFGKGGLNSYAYCLGDPINRIDPSGHLSLKTLAKLIMNLQTMKKRATITTALNPKDRMEYLNSIIANSLDKHRQAIFAADFKGLQTSPTSLRDAAANTIKFNNISLDEMPNQIKTIVRNTPTPPKFRALLEYIHDAPINSGSHRDSVFSPVKLWQAEVFGFDLPRHNSPATWHDPEIAKIYSTRVNTFPANHTQLFDEAEKLRNMI